MAVLNMKAAVHIKHDEMASNVKVRSVDIERISTSMHYRLPRVLYPQMIAKRYRTPEKTSRKQSVIDCDAFKKLSQKNEFMKNNFACIPGVQDSEKIGRIENFGKFACDMARKQYLEINGYNSSIMMIAGCVNRQNVTHMINKESKNPKRMAPGGGGTFPTRIVKAAA